MDLKKLKQKHQAKEWHKKNYKTRVRNRHLIRKFGITLVEYKKMSQDQCGLCKICYSPQSEFKRDFAVDHCHKTGKIRGLLCGLCNIGLGSFRDNQELMLKAVEYLRAA